MTRDMEFVRKILLELERSKDFAPDSQSLYAVHGATNDIAAMRNLLWHLQLMEQAGLVKLRWEEFDNWESSGPTFAGAQITWRGHDFLDNIRNDAVWSRTKQQLGKVGGTASLEVVAQVAASFVKQILGLPG